MPKYAKPMREVILDKLPARKAKRWVSALVLKRSDPRLNSRTLYQTLKWMTHRGWALRRENAETGLHEYAKPPMSVLRELGYRPGVRDG